MAYLGRLWSVTWCCLLKELVQRQLVRREMAMTPLMSQIVVLPVIRAHILLVELTFANNARLESIVIVLVVPHAPHVVLAIILLLVLRLVLSALLENILTLERVFAPNALLGRLTVMQEESLLHHVANAMLESILRLERVVAHPASLVIILIVERVIALNVLLERLTVIQEEQVLQPAPHAFLASILSLDTHSVFHAMLGIIQLLVLQAAPHALLARTLLALQVHPAPHALLERTLPAFQVHLAPHALLERILLLPVHQLSGCVLLVLLGNILIVTILRLVTRALLECLLLFLAQQDVFHALLDIMQLLLVLHPAPHVRLEQLHQQELLPAHPLLLHHQALHSHLNHRLNRVLQRYPQQLFLHRRHRRLLPLPLHRRLPPRLPLRRLPLTRPQIILLPNLCLQWVLVNMWSLKMLASKGLITSPLAPHLALTKSLFANL